MTEAVRGIFRAGGVHEHYVTWEMTWRAAPTVGHVQLGGQRTGHEGYRASGAREIKKKKNTLENVI